jgi:holo-[acyl-carrier protein] synthase
MDVDDFTATALACVAPREFAMDILGLGTEIVECARIRAMIEEHGERFLARVYSSEEIRWCQSSKNATECYASLWAAKEAVFKCLRIIGRTGSPWAQVEIEFRDDAPTVKVRGVLREKMIRAGVGHIAVSTAFTRHYAMATAIAIRSPA